MTSLKIDYYFVEMPEDADDSFGEIITDIGNSTNDESRNEDYYGAPIRLQHYLEQGGLLLGDMVKIRMDDIPPKTSLAGREEDIELESDEGLGEGTAFCYDPSNSVLSIQRNRYAVTASAFVYYIEEKGGIEPIEFKPILREDAYRRMAGMSDHRKFEIAVAPLNNLNMFKGQGKSVDSIVNLVKEFESPTINITMSMGNRRGGLKQVLRNAQRLLEIRDNTSDGEAGERPAVTKILVSGKPDENTPTEVVDLIEDRFVDEIKVEYDRDHEKWRSIRQSAVYRKYKSQKTAINKIVKE